MSKANKVIIVLGGGVDKSGSLEQASKERLEKAVEVFNEMEKVVMIMSGKWSFLDNDNPPRATEAEAMKKYAEILGIDRQSILVEDFSQDTISNAYYTKELIEEKNLGKDVLVVSSDYHMKRVEYVFKFVYGKEYRLEFEEASSELTPDVLREKYETNRRIILLNKYLFENKFLKEILTSNYY